ncbi:TPA: hypothetical protein N0F65_011690 [Lagenidium giganteum]|uniref:Anoctamin transmembrane domain-containing protein n=1 Tax=Lagenidium giganteum TaxID=4803 RepID=A0AAV2YU72_9STRA|nr:TPA: hypothetical protein N0F65_011690 [Lagenidium giganteum]
MGCERDHIHFRLQVSNHPFDQFIHEDKLKALETEIARNELGKCKQYLKTVRPLRHHQKPKHQQQYKQVAQNSVPEMDPLLTDLNHEDLSRARIIRRQLNLDTLADDDHIDGDMFALHDPIALDDLWASGVLNLRMIPQPLNKICMYFGEKMALYFSWLGVYIKMLTKKALGSESRGNEGDILVCLAFVIVIWSLLFMGIWNRKNTLLKALWGLHKVHNPDRPRGSFEGAIGYNKVYDHPEMIYRSMTQRYVAFAFSFLVMLITIFLVMIVNAVVFYIKCLGCSRVFGFIVDKLDDFEFYLPVFYVAFAKEIFKGACFQNNCMAELERQLMVMLTASVQNSNYEEAIKPCVKYGTWNAVNLASRESEAIERQVEIDAYEDDEQFRDYCELVMPFGYATVFVVACPLAPALALANNTLCFLVNIARELIIPKTPVELEQLMQRQEYIADQVVKGV